MKKGIKVCVDFDGTCVTHDFPKVGMDIGAVPVLKELVKNGHHLILFTMRSNCKDNTGASDCVPEVHNGNFLDDAVNWFKENDIPLFGIQVNPEQSSWTTSPKAYGEIYIDDASLGCPLVHGQHKRPYVDWKKIKALLIERKLIDLIGDESVAIDNGDEDEYLFSDDCNETDHGGEIDESTGGFVIAQFTTMKKDTHSINTVNEFDGFLTHFSPNGQFIFEPNIAKAHIFKSENDCIFKDMQTWQYEKNYEVYQSGVYKVLSFSDDLKLKDTPILL